jgi:hypothetical protein
MIEFFIERKPKSRLKISKEALKISKEGLKI